MQHINYYYILVSDDIEYELFMLLLSIFTFRLHLPSLHAHLKLILKNTTERTLLICKPQNAYSFFLLYIILHSCHLCMQYESAVNCGWYVGTLSEAEIKIKYIHNQI